MFDEHWGFIRRLSFCLGCYAVLGVLFYVNGAFGGRLAGLLLVVFAANTLYLYRSIIVPLREVEALYLRFNRGYDSRAIFSKPVCFTAAEQQSLAKISHLLDNQEVNRLSNRQAQYLALQNQINPHFLYNTLEAIRGDALSMGMRDIATITEALATFFRYTISNMDNLVSLEEELGNAENYFAIQNYRFGERIAWWLMARAAKSDPSVQLEGSWHGNDTIWRTCLDLNRALLYAGPDGQLRETPQREEISIVDAVIAGQGEGPLAPEPLPTGAVFAARNPAVGDWLGARLLGFDPARIPLLRHAVDDMRWRICAVQPEVPGFQPPFPPARAPKGWAGHIEARRTAL